MGGDLSKGFKAPTIAICEVDDASTKVYHVDENFKSADRLDKVEEKKKSQSSRNVKEAEAKSLEMQKRITDVFDKHNHRFQEGYFFLNKSNLCARPVLGKQSPYAFWISDRSKEHASIASDDGEEKTMLDFEKELYQLAGYDMQGTLEEPQISKIEPPSADDDELDLDQEQDIEEEAPVRVRRTTNPMYDYEEEEDEVYEDEPELDDEDSRDLNKSHEAPLLNKEKEDENVEYEDDEHYEDDEQYDDDEQYEDGEYEEDGEYQDEDGREHDQERGKREEIDDGREPEEEEEEYYSEADEEEISEIPSKPNTPVFREPEKLLDSPKLTISAPSPVAKRRKDVEEEYDEDEVCEDEEEEEVYEDDEDEEDDS